MTAIAALKSQRDDILSEVKALAKAAENAGRGFTAAEEATVTERLAKANEINADITRFESLAAKSGQLDALLDGGDHIDHIERLDIDGKPVGNGAKGRDEFGRTARRKNARFAKAIESRLFGVPVVKHSEGKRFDAYGDDDNRKADLTALRLGSGRVSVPVATRSADGGGLMLLPEWGGTLLALFDKPQLTGDDEYMFRRQTTRDTEAAGFVPKRSTKPSMSFGFEKVRDRVRTIAVLSDPLAIQDLQDIPLMRDDVANELANRVIWRLENAVVNGQHVAGAGDETEEEFDGILNTTGVREQAYLTSPFHTIRRSLTTLETSGYDPDALTIGLNPITWEAFETEADGTGRPLYPNLYTARQQPILFGRPVVLSNAIAEDEFITADWRNGAITLRTELELAWSDGGAELFDKNQVKFRAELRAGFNLTQPGAFVHGSLTAA